MGSVEYLPNAAGSLTNLSKYPNTGSNYEKVNDENNDTYVYTYSTSIVIDTYNFADVSDLGTITSVIVDVLAGVSNGGTGYATPILRIGSTNYGSEQSIDGFYRDKTQEWTANPSTSASWQWSDLNSAQIGVGLRTNDGAKNANCGRVGIIINYTTPGGGSGQVRVIGMAM